MVKLISILLFVGLSIHFSSIAEAKGKARAFSYFDDGGKHTQGECDPEKKAPRKMKHRKEVAKIKGYLGSELIETAQESPDGVEAWKHYFSSSSSCNDSLHHPAKH